MPANTSSNTLMPSRPFCWLPAGSASPRIGIVGAGVMGRGIAAAALRHGFHLTLLDQSPGVAESAVDELRNRHDPGEAPSDGAVVCAATDLAALRDLELVVEAVPEVARTKQNALREIEEAVDEQTLIATNTSSLSVDRLAGTLQHPERFCGLHFCHPVQERRLVEVVRCTATAPEALRRASLLMRSMGKMPIVIGDSPGFVINRLLVPYLNEALELVLEGHSIPDIEATARQAGMPVGPFEQMDRMGLDVAVRVGTQLFFRYPERLVPSELLVAIFKSGRLGAKTGAGFFDWQDGRCPAIPSQVVAEMIAERQKPGDQSTAEQRTIRLLLPMLLESFRLLEEGIAASPREIDLALAEGLGFRAHGIGLLAWADRCGGRRIESWRRELATLGTRFAPPIARAA